MTHGRAVAKQIGMPERSGVPWMVILDGSGEKLVTSDGPRGNVGFPFEPHEIEYFLTMLKSSAKHLSENWLSDVETALNEAAKGYGRQ